MKLPKGFRSDGRYHQHCWGCRAETVEPVVRAGQTHYFCRSCGQTYPRSLIFDPAITWWVDRSGEYWHEVSGIFVRDPAGRFLFFERLKFPFGLTVPAGHVDAGEEPTRAAARELLEETGLRAGRLTHIATDHIVGDSCRRGCDAHRWHSFRADVSDATTPQIQGEGDRPVWLTLDQALRADPTFATRFVIARHATALLR